MYFNYHGNIKKKIKEQKLSHYEFRDDYKNLGYVLLLYFNDGKVYPIRKENIVLYMEYIEKYSKNE